MMGEVAGRPSSLVSNKYGRPATIPQRLADTPLPEPAVVLRPGRHRAAMLHPPTAGPVERRTTHPTYALTLSPARLPAPCAGLDTVPVTIVRSSSDAQAKQFVERTCPIAFETHANPIEQAEAFAEPLEALRPTTRCACSCFPRRSRTSSARVRPQRTMRDAW